MNVTTKRKLLRAVLLASSGFALIALLGAARTAAGAAPAAAQDMAGRCSALAGSKVPSGVVERAEHVAVGGKLVTEKLTGPAAALSSLTTPVGFCRVRARLEPTKDSKILVETWLPDTWNGKLLGVGGGGFSGGLPTMALMLRIPLSKGYAGVATDVGHDASDGAQWAFGHREKLIDYGYRGNHLAALTAKALIRGFYGTPETHAYFQGCSNGGREALMEVSRFPTDYDGVIAGAPATSFTPLFTGFVFNNLAVSAAPGLAAKLPLVNAAVLKKCDVLDGVKDGVLENPSRCAFDPAELQCKAGAGPDCLDAGEVAALRKLYQGARLRSGQSVISGFAVGGETTDWTAWITSPKSSQINFGTEFYRWMVIGDPNWDKAGFDLDRDYRLAEQRVAPILDSDNPDIRAFVGRGGKLIVYHGWSDPAVPPGSSLRYFQAVQRRSDPQGKAVRLFMVPGMGHCFNGPGATAFDMLPELDRWVEHGPAPERVVANKPENAIFALLGLPTKSLRSRPLCAWPKTARYNGSGSTDDATNFTCAVVR